MPPSPVTSVAISSEAQRSRTSPAKAACTCPDLPWRREATHSPLTPPTSARAPAMSSSATRSDARESVATAASASAEVVNVASPPKCAPLTPPPGSTRPQDFSLPRREGGPCAPPSTWTRSPPGGAPSPPSAPSAPPAPSPSSS